MGKLVKVFLFHSVSIHFLLTGILTRSITQAHADVNPTAAAREKGRLPPLVTRLHRLNFDRVIRNNEFVLVEFFDPECGACQVFRPTYLRVARILKDSVGTMPRGRGRVVRVGKLNAVQNWGLAVRYDVSLVPTIILFRHGVPIRYAGQKSAHPLAHWVLNIVNRETEYGN